MHEMYYKYKDENEKIFVSKSKEKTNARAHFSHASIRWVARHSRINLAINEKQILKCISRFPQNLSSFSIEFKEKEMRNRTNTFPFIKVNHNNKSECH